MHPILTYAAGLACFVLALPAALYSLRRDLRRAWPVITTLFSTSKHPSDLVLHSRGWERAA